MNTGAVSHVGRVYMCPSQVRTGSRQVRIRFTPGSHQIHIRFTSGSHQVHIRMTSGSHPMRV
eukprot:10082546-Lingulodinium_polyedra.AAC.1